MGLCELVHGYCCAVREMSRPVGELVHGYCCAVREMNWYMAIAVLLER